MHRPENTMAALPDAETIDAGVILDLYRKGGCDLVVVLGPTASGKTRYAVKLARQFGDAEIISADSRQVYRGMDIGTGKDLSEYGDIPYRLIDIEEAGAQYNVYRFREDFIEAWNDIRSRGKVPILCGGTGLYISAITSGYDFRETKPLSEAKDRPSSDDRLPSSPYFIGTLVSRELRNERIDKRLEARIEEGMIDEIRGLLDKGVSPDVLISYGLEYKFVTKYLLGEFSLDEMKILLATAIHQFAKRQMTWFRGMERSGITIHWTEV